MADVLIIHAGERLALSRDLRVGSLLVGLKLEAPARLDLGGFDLRFDQLEISGAGAFSIVDGPATLLSMTAASPDTRIVIRADLLRR